MRIGREKGEWSEGKEKIRSFANFTCTNSRNGKVVVALQFEIVDVTSRERAQGIYTKGGTVTDRTRGRAFLNFVFSGSSPFKLAAFNSIIGKRTIIEQKRRTCVRTRYTC